MMLAALFFFLFFHFGGATVKPGCEIDLSFGGDEALGPTSELFTAAN